MALLEVNQLGKRFGGLLAVNDVSFNVEPGQIKAVIGPNGAGKTTLFNMISGTFPATTGKVSFKGRELKRQKPFQVATLGMARTFQNIKMFSGMTALENVMVGRHVQSNAGFLASMFRMPWTWKEEKDIREKSLELLALLEIEEYADTDASSLAFGQQRAVELARAL
ncbi:MAG: ATP-binding cassette domain-containing protein, partial [Desulfocapsa sp.]|nr:ATP-binding cassette domain-containing protein [Desulfocapsa sp.]